MAIMNKFKRLNLADRRRRLFKSKVLGGSIDDEDYRELHKAHLRNLAREKQSVISKKRNDQIYALRRHLDRFNDNNPHMGEDPELQKIYNSSSDYIKALENNELMSQKLATSLIPSSSSRSMGKRKSKKEAYKTNSIVDAISTPGFLVVPAIMKSIKADLERYKNSKDNDITTQIAIFISLNFIGCKKA